MNQHLDIVTLINNSPITHLTNDFQTKLLHKIQTTFTDDQQHLFVASFYTYLNYNSKTDFVIDLDNVWKWIGFSRKDPAKRVIEKYFTKDIDFIIIKAAPQLGGAGLNREQILMNVIQINLYLFIIIYDMLNLFIIC
jgi:hypothetical protein